MWWSELVDLVLPVDCAGCGVPRSLLCAACERELRAGRAVHRAYPEPVPAGLPAVFAAAGYADVVRAVLLAHKERGVLRLAGPLGAALAAAVRAVPGVVRPGAGAGGAAAGGRAGAGAGGAGLLVPVPSGRRAVAARGHDPMLRIARSAAAELRRGGVVLRPAPLLAQVRPVADQSGLAAAERQRNLAGALRVRAGAEGLLRGRPVVLVDDLMTTGASLTEAARAVAAAGGSVRGAAVVAASRLGGADRTGGRAGARV